ncbi:MAG: acyl-CoA dehydrogenase family protein [Pseudomonadales bacterium]
MNFDLTEPQQLLAESTRRFIEREFPIAQMRAVFNDPKWDSRAWWQACAELGWAAFFVPEEFGGAQISDSPWQDAAIVAEEVGRMVTPGPFLPSNVVAWAIAKAGTEAQKSQFLPGIVDGRLIPAWAYGEPGSLWDPGGLAISADWDAHGLILRGEKAYVEAGAQADLFLVTARTRAGLVQVLLSADTPGVHIVPGRSIDLGKSFASIRFHDVSVSREALLGDPAAAPRVVDDLMNLALLLQCAESNGATGRAFDMTLEYMDQRRTFGRKLTSYQALKHRIADNLLWLESCRATTDAVADAFDSGDERRIDELASVAKAYVGDRSVQIISDCTQLHGGIGITWEHDLHLLQRRATVNRAVFGTPEQHLQRLFRRRYVVKKPENAERETR